MTERDSQDSLKMGTRVILGDWPHLMTRDKLALSPMALAFISHLDMRYSLQEKQAQWTKMKFLPPSNTGAQIEIKFTYRRINKSYISCVPECVYWDLNSKHASTTNVYREQNTNGAF